MGSEQKTIHKLASAIIVLAVGLNSFVLLKNFDKWGVYYMLFLGSAAFDIMSHGLKEAVVRSVPIDQGKFNLRISIAQLVSGLILAPILLSISYKYETYQAGSKLAEYQLTGNDFMKFFGEYFSMGLQCAFNFSDNPEFVYDSDEKDVCKFTLLPMIFYVLSIFGLQLTIQTVSSFETFLTLFIAHGQQVDRQREDDLCIDGSHDDWSFLVGLRDHPQDHEAKRHHDQARRL